MKAKAATVTVYGMALAMVLGAMGCQVGTSGTGIERPKAEPDMVLGARPDGVAASKGVALWQIYDMGFSEETLTAIVIGTDKNDNALTETHVHNGLRNGQRVMEVQQLGAEAGVVRLTEDDSDDVDTLKSDDAHAELFEVLDELQRYAAERMDAKSDLSSCVDTCMDATGCNSNQCELRCALANHDALSMAVVGQICEGDAAGVSDGKADSKKKSKKVGWGERGGRYLDCAGNRVLQGLNWIRGGIAWLFGGKDSKKTKKNTKKLNKNADKICNRAFAKK